MPICAVSTCRNRSIMQNIARAGVSYHRFPKHPRIREKWIAATGRQNWIPSKVATICSDHFEPRHFVLKTGDRRYLHTLAVPCRNLETQHRYNAATHAPVGVHHTALSSAGYISISPLQPTNYSQCPPVSPISHYSPETNNFGNHSESNDDITSIEVEIMPQNRIILRPRNTESLQIPDANLNTQSGGNDIKVIKLLQAKIQEQDLLIRKLKVRNQRLKKRLFSLKSMESMDS